MAYWKYGVTEQVTAVKVLGQNDPMFVSESVEEIDRIVTPGG
jgi:hypothetical protein